jgi:uncharacterized ferritin-like protein (DUF455 family)
MIRFKKGVHVNDLRYPIIHAIKEAHYEYQALDLDLTITEWFRAAGSNSPHMVGSYHHSGLAVDCRTWKVENPQKLAQAIKKRLGQYYDVIVEDTHIHIEFDERRFREENYRSNSDYRAPW